MKHLNVKWVPETVAIFSLTVSVAPQMPACHRASAQFKSAPASAVPCTRFIVISKESKLKADVLTERVNSHEALPQLVEMS
jgi:hypothetical protein